MSDRKEALEKLKQVRLELFRSAADLDMVIRGIELEIDERQDEEFVRMYIHAEAEFRRRKAEANGWNEIYKLEEGVWQQF